MTNRWVPIMGQFDCSPERIVFDGRPVVPLDSAGQPQPQQPPQATAGIALCDQKMANGNLRASVEFTDVTPLSVCELIVRYDVRTRAMITAGLGGSWGMFSIRQWVAPSSPESVGAWTNHQLTGDRANLRPGVPYDLVVLNQGSVITLEVDGVQVATSALPTMSSQASQTGIFCLGQSPITLRGFTVETERPKAFIVMQFSSPYNEVYSEVIKAVCDDFSIDAVRADEIYGPGIIIRDVIDSISRSQVVIADISPSNCNVYFEVGYALAMGKPIILLAQRRAADTPLPFDLSAFRVLFYDDTIGGKPKVEAGLRNHLREILGRSAQ